MPCKVYILLINMFATAQTFRNMFSNCDTLSSINAMIITALLPYFVQVFPAHSELKITVGSFMHVILLHGKVLSKNRLIFVTKKKKILLFR